MMNFEKHQMKPRGEQRQEPTGLESSGSGHLQGTTRRLSLERLVVAIIALLLAAFAVLLSVALHAEITGASGSASMVSGLLAPIGMGILLALACLALLADRNTE